MGRAFQRNTPLSLLFRYGYLKRSTMLSTRLRNNSKTRPQTHSEQGRPGQKARHSTFRHTFRQLPETRCTWLDAAEPSAGVSGNAGGPLRPAAIDRRPKAPRMAGLHRCAALALMPALAAADALRLLGRREAGDAAVFLPAVCLLSMFACQLRQ